MGIINDNEKINKLSDNSNIHYIKVCLLGIDKSGKTNFLNRFINRNNFNNFKESIQVYTPTLGASYLVLSVEHKSKLFKLEIWDTAGDLKWFSLTRIYVKDANIILNFYDPFNKDSFEYIKKCYQIVKEMNNVFPCSYILIKNKCNLKETKDKKIMVPDEEILEYADKHNLSFRNLSILEKYDSGIEEIIEDCFNDYLYKNNKKL